MLARPGPFPASRLPDVFTERLEEGKGGALSALFLSGMPSIMDTGTCLRCLSFRASAWKGGEGRKDLSDHRGRAYVRHVCSPDSQNPPTQYPPTHPQFY